MAAAAAEPYHAGMRAASVRRPPLFSKTYKNEDFHTFIDVLHQFVRESDASPQRTHTRTHARTK